MRRWTPSGKGPGRVPLEKGPVFIFGQYTIRPDDHSCHWKYCTFYGIDHFEAYVFENFLLDLFGGCRR